MGKIETSEVKRGKILKIDDKLYKVNDLSHTHMARWGATYTFKVKDIIAGKTNTFTYQSGTVLEEAEVSTNNGVYLYNAGNSYSFMENDTGEMFDLDEDMISDITPYLKENLDIFLMKYEGNVINIILPTTISYKITSTPPGVKGDRATAGKKPATLETGLEVMVPLFKDTGDVITVNTLTWEAN